MGLQARLYDGAVGHYSNEFSEVVKTSIESVEMKDIKRGVLNQQISNNNIQKSDLGWGIYCVQPNA